VGQHVADDRETRGLADDVGAGGGGEATVDPHPVVDAIGDGRGRQPRGEPELVEPIELADLDGEQPLHGRRVRLEVRSIDPHPDHLRSGVDAVVRLDGREHVLAGGDVRGARPDDVAKHSTDPIAAAHHEQRLGRRAGVLEPDRHHLIAVVRGAPARPAELPILEVADGVRGIQAVLGEEGAQRRAIRRHASDGRWPARDRDRGHQSGVAGGVAFATGVAVAGGVAIAAKPGAFDRRSSRAATASASDVA
jgi:hypothetical protein